MRFGIVFVLLALVPLGCSGKAKCNQARAHAHKSWSALVKSDAVGGGKPDRLSRAAGHMLELFDKDRKLEEEWAARVKAGIALAKLAHSLAKKKCGSAAECHAQKAEIDTAIAHADEAIRTCKNVKPCNE